MGNLVIGYCAEEINMSLIGDMAEEGCVANFVSLISRKIDENKDKPDVVLVLKEIGRAGCRQCGGVEAEQRHKRPFSHWFLCRQQAGDQQQFLEKTPMERRLEIQRQKGSGNDFVEEGNCEKLIRILVTDTIQREFA